MNRPLSDQITISPEEAIKQLDLLNVASQKMAQASEEQPTSILSDERLVTSLTDDICKIVLSVLKLDRADFSPTTPLMDYGLDSIAATEIGNLFTGQFEIVIPPTVFFEFQDLKSFVDYLLENYLAELQEFYPETGVESDAKTSVNETKVDEPEVITRNSAVNSASTNIDEQVLPAIASSDKPMSIEALWQATEQAEDIDAKNQRLNVKSPPVPRSEPAVDKAILSESKQPSRQHLKTMQAYADRAVIHQINRVDKHPLEYATYGEGPPLLMLGGLLMHYSVMWLVNMKALGEHHQLIMFHMPGCGSLELNDNMTLETLANDISDVLDAHGIAAALPVFGCSFGGVLAQSFAIRYPERCSALAITVSTPFAEGATDFQLLMKELQMSSRFMELNRGWPMASLPAYEKVIEDFDFREALTKLDMPSLIVSGGRDQYTTAAYSRMMAESLNGSQLVEISDAGHLLTFSHHEEFNRLLIEFLAEPTKTLTLIPEQKKETAFLPATSRSLELTQTYIENGQQGHCVILSAHAGQLALTLNVLCNQNKTRPLNYRSYFLTSLEEAFDAAIRLSRQHERNKNPKTSGKILIIDQSETWRHYFNPLKQEQAEALVPNIEVASNTKQAEVKLKQEDFIAVAVVANQDLTIVAVETWITMIKKHGALSILLEVDDHQVSLDQWLSCQITQHPDIVVFGEGISGYQAPVGAMLVNETVKNPWLMTPNEGYVRQPMASFGLPLKLAFEYLARELDGTFSNEQQYAIRQIATNQEAAYQAHLDYANVGYAKVANMHGYDAQFFEAYGVRSRIVRKGERSREIIDCLANVGSAPRGLNPQDIIENVVKTHIPQHNYWQDLGEALRSKTGFLHTLPCSSQTTAIESALSLAHMSTSARKRNICFSGGAGFSLLSANSAMDTVFDLFRKPFLPLYPHTVFIDPAAENATELLEKELLGGELAFVWMETIQIEGNAVRPLPKNLIDLINRHRKAGGYLVAVDETQTNLSTGKFLHSEGLIDAPDIVALSTGLTDSLFPIGAVLASEEVIQRAETVNSARLNQLKNRSANQLSAHIALHALHQIDQENVMEHTAKMGRYLKQSLNELAESFPLIKEVRGEGLVVAVEFDLAGYDAFVQQSFGYFLWGAMLRDQAHGVAVVVCPVHNRSIRIMPPLVITRDEIDIIIANLGRRMAEGVAGIVQSCADYATRRNDNRTAEFLLSTLETDGGKSDG